MTDARRRDPGLTCPWCRYDVTDFAPADGTITCPECGRTSTPIEAHGAALHLAARPAAFTREAIIGGSVGMLIGALGACWGLASGLPRPLWALTGALWAGSLALGAAGWTVGARRPSDRDGPYWLFAAASFTVGWIAAVHAVVAMIVVIVIAARV